MENYEKALENLPPETQKTVESIWKSLTPTQKDDIHLLLNAIPTKSNLLQLLLDFSAKQVKMTFGNKKKIAIVGPTNAGKSTLYNQLIRENNQPSEVSSIPGTTRINLEADTGLFVVVDTPGADAAGELGDLDKQEAIRAATDADFLIIVYDATQGITNKEYQLHKLLLNLNKPFIVLLNKIDLVKKEKKEVIDQVATMLDIQSSQIIPTNAINGENLDKVIKAMIVIEPGLTAALGQGLPKFRWRLAWRSIVSAASISALVALTPLPIIDFAPLVAAQAVMVLGIARIYNYQITVKRAKELVVTFGIGFLGRTLFYELSKFGGIPGWVLAAAIASSTTIAVGYAASIWFEKGEKLSSNSLRKITTEMTKVILTSLKEIGKKKPEKKRLRKRILDTLENSPFGKDRSLLDEKLQEEVNNKTPENS